MVQRAVVTLALYSLLSSNRTGVFLAFFPIYLVSIRHASVAAALLFMSAGYLAGSLVGPLAGRWSDRTGRRKPFLVGAELGALPFYVSIPFLPDAVTAGLSFVAGTIVLSIGMPALQAFVADVTKEGERGVSYGTLTSSSAAGSIAGFMVVALLIDSFGFSFLFYFAGVAMVGTGVYVLLLVSDTTAGRREGIKSIGTLKPLILFSCVVSIRTLGSGAAGAFYGVWATMLGANNFDVGLIAVAGLATTAFAGMQSGRWVDRHGEMPNLFLGTAAAVTAFTVFMIAPTWSVLIPAQAIRQLGFALVSPAMLVWVSKLAPEGRRAEYLGIFALINSSLWSLGPAMGGMAYHFGGSTLLFLSAIFTGLASIVAMYIFHFGYRKQSNRLSAGDRTMEEKPL